MTKKTFQKAAKRVFDNRSAMGTFTCLELAMASGGYNLYQDVEEVRFYSGLFTNFQYRHDHYKSCDRLLKKIYNNKTEEIKDLRVMLLLMAGEVLDDFND